MKTIEYHELGDPADVLRLVDEAPKPLAPGEVRVSVLVTPIHPSNLLQIAGHYGISPDLPSVPGTEGIGRVVELASDVTQLVEGQRVMLANSGTWRQEMTGPATSFIALPDSGDAEQLSMLTVNPLTASLLLSEFVALKPGDWIVQSGANSAVGEYVIQLAKQRGVKTVNVVRRDNLASSLVTLGADAVVVDGPDLGRQIREATDNSPCPLAIDCVAGETFSRLLEALTDGGTIVSYGAMSMTPPTLDARALIFRDIRVRGFWLAQWFETASTAERQQAFGEIIPLVASGAIKANIDSRFTLDEIVPAVRRAAESGRDGKVLLVPNAR